MACEPVLLLSNFSLANSTRPAFKFVADNPVNDIEESTVDPPSISFIKFPISVSFETTASLIFSNTA